MKIESFWAQGFRSLRDVRVEGFGAFNILYGPNGGGKSNLLDAIRTLLELTRFAAGAENPAEPNRERADAAIAAGVVARRDLCVRDNRRAITLGATFSGLDHPVQFPIPGAKLSLSVTLSWIIDSEPRLRISELSLDGLDVLTLWRGHPRGDEEGTRVRAFLLEELNQRAYGLVSADRAPRSEVSQAVPSDQDIVQWHLREGRLKSALLAAQIGPSHEVRRRLAALRGLLSGPPLHRPPFDPVQDQRTGSVDLRELLPEPNPEGLDISIDLVGLGVAQIYFILAKAMLLGTRVVGIEEPEAHLHAPTSGRALRQLLVRLVEEKHVDQLFIATHSNLFDLDPTGYFDVSIEDGVTRVRREDLTRIDREHLYEPGPAKHALQRLLQYAPPGDIVFRRGDGTGVTAGEMLRLLQEDDEIAVSFLQDIHGAALRMIKVHASRQVKGG